MPERTEGPPAGVYRTYSGEVDGRKVHWVGNPEAGDKWEAAWVGKTRLWHLLTLNAYTVEGLTVEEFEETKRLINSEPETELDCPICRRSGEHNKQIAGLTICRGHARYALVSQT